MKVLIVSSSPRKEGNSDVLCDRFARGASEAGHEVEKIMLRDKKIREAFKEWIDNGHNNFDDENTCILRIELTNGVLLSHGTRYNINFGDKSC